VEGAYSNRALFLDGDKDLTCAVVAGGRGPWTDQRATSSCAVGTYRSLNVLNC